MGRVRGGVRVHRPFRSPRFDAGHEASYSCDAVRLSRLPDRLTRQICHAASVEHVRTECKLLPESVRAWLQYTGTVIYVYAIDCFSRNGRSKSKRKKSPRATKRSAVRATRPLGPAVRQLLARLPVQFPTAFRFIVFDRESFKGFIVRKCSLDVVPIIIIIIKETICKTKTYLPVRFFCVSAYFEFLLVTHILWRNQGGLPLPRKKRKKREKKEKRRKKKKGNKKN